MKITEFQEMMQSVAPKEYTLDFDNVGLLVGTTRKEIKKVLVALDCTLPVAKEAIEIGADIVLTHHPIIFKAIKHILPDDPKTAAIFTLMQNNIGVFSAHTNLDAADGGVNDCLCELFGINNPEIEPTEHIVRVGELPIPLKLSELVLLANKSLNTIARCSCAYFEKEPNNVTVSRVGFLGGCGGWDIHRVKNMGADVFITGEIAHDEAIEAATMGLSIIEAGHYETERVVLSPLISHLQKLSYGVQYTLTNVETAALKAFV